MAVSAPPMLLLLRGNSVKGIQGLAMLLSVSPGRGPGPRKSPWEHLGRVVVSDPPAPILSPKCFPLLTVVSSVPSGSDSLNQCLRNHSHILYFNKVVAKIYPKNQTKINVSGVSYFTGGWWGTATRNACSPS